MHKEFEYKKLLKYPHMKPRDVAIWERFMLKYPDFLDTVIYDYHVGEGADFLPTGTDTPEGRENRLYQKKIDVLGFAPNKIYIAEVKPRADIKALGQAITYEELISTEVTQMRSVHKMVICEGVDTDMEAVYNKMEVDIFVV